MGTTETDPEQGSIQFQPTGIDGVVLLAVADSRKRFSMEHRSLVLTAVSGGVGQFRYRSWTEAAYPGQVMIFEPGTLHATTSVDEPASFRALFLSPEIVQRALPAPPGVGPFHFDVPALSSADFFEGVGRLQDLLLDQGREQEDKRECLVRALAELLPRASRALALATGGRTRDEARADRAVVLKVAGQIREAYARSLRECEPPGRVVEVTKLAEAEGLSDVTLIRAFERVMGTSPYHYLTALRIRRARELIDGGPAGSIATLTDVAQAAGFFDSSHFSNHFKAHMGAPPSHYARAMHRLWRRAPATPRRARNSG